MSDRAITGVLLLAGAAALFYGWVHGLFGAQLAQVVGAAAGTPATKPAKLPAF